MDRLLGRMHHAPCPGMCGCGFSMARVAPAVLKASFFSDRRQITSHAETAQHRNAPVARVNASDGREPHTPPPVRSAARRRDERPSVGVQQHGGNVQQHGGNAVAVQF